MLMLQKLVTNTIYYLPEKTTLLFHEQISK